MRRILTIALALTFCLAMSTAMAATLYEQEGTDDDGYRAIDASGQGPAENPSTTNWKYQTGAGSWSGVYAYGEGWREDLVVEDTGDSQLDIEADIEMFYTEDIWNNKIYFHFGNPFHIGDNARKAVVSGTVAYNNGMYIGISFEGTGKTESDLQTDEEGHYTGRITNAMKFVQDGFGRTPDHPNVDADYFDVTILLSWDGGVNYNTPVSFGAGADNTIVETLWWLVNGGAVGQYDIRWLVELHPDTYQTDGNYVWDPAFVAAPVL